MNDKTKEVVIVGGGSSGIIAAYRLVNNFAKLSEHSQSAGLNITLIEKEKDSLATGLPYHKEAQICLLNHPTKHMSAFGEDRLHFLRWCVKHKITDSRGNFTGQETYHSRAVYGEYLKHILAETEERVKQLQASGVPVSFSTVYDQVVDIEEGHNNQYILHQLKNQKPFEADFVIMALGHQSSEPPPSMADVPCYYHNPVDLIPKDRTKAPPDFGSNAVIIGTGPSMIDAVRILEFDDRYYNHITLISNNGLTPYCNDSSDTCVYQKRFLTPENLKPPLTADTLISWIKQEIESVATGANPPQHPHIHALFGLRSDLPSQLLPPNELLDFAKKFGSQWIHYLNQPTCPESYDLIERLRKEGTLTILNGRVNLEQSEYKPKDQDPLKLNFTPVINFSQGDHDSPSGIIDASIVVNCLGVTGGVKKPTDPLLKNLLKRGLVQSNVLGSGCEVDDACRPRKPDGHCPPGLFLVGPLTAPPLAGFGISMFSRQATKAVDQIMEQIVTHGGNAHRLPQHADLELPDHSNQPERELVLERTG